MVKCRDCKNGDLAPLGTCGFNLQFTKCRFDKHNRASDKERICPHGVGWIVAVCPGGCGYETSYRPDNPRPPRFCDQCGKVLVKAGASS
jgi:hypothetical protein